MRTLVNNHEIITQEATLKINMVELAWGVYHFNYIVNNLFLRTKTVFSPIQMENLLKLTKHYTTIYDIENMRTYNLFRAGFVPL